MPRNGSGVFIRDNSAYTGSGAWSGYRDAGTKITSAHHDFHDSDIATAITQSIATDGQSVVSANLPMAGFSLTNLGAATIRTQPSRVDQVQNGAFSYGGVATGALNNYAVTLAPAPTTNPGGQVVFFVANNSNTGNCVLSTNGLTPLYIRKQNGTVDLEAGDILASQLVGVVSDGAFWHLLNLASLSVATAPTTWTPTLTCSGSMTNLGTVVDDVRYSRVGPWIEFALSMRIALGGTASTHLYINPPVVGVDFSGNAGFACYAIDANGTTVPNPVWTYYTGKITVTKGSNWTLGGAGAVNINGKYRAI